MFVGSGFCYFASAFMVKIWKYYGKMKIVKKERDPNGLLDTETQKTRHFSLIWINPIELLFMINNQYLDFDLRK